jgi:hypothetical protein
MVEPDGRSLPPRLRGYVTTSLRECAEAASEAWRAATEAIPYLGAGVTIKERKTEMPRASACRRPGQDKIMKIMRLESRQQSKAPDKRAETGGRGMRSNRF